MVASAIIGASSAKKAAKAQEQAAANANALIAQQQTQTRSDLQPYRDSGTSDFSKYNDLLGTGSGGLGAVQSTLNSIPGYQFTQTQGLKATQNAAAARGLGISGAALKGAATYATGLANSTYGTYANQLLSGATLGENAATAGAQTGAAAAGAEAGNITGAGNAQAAGDIAVGKAITAPLTTAENIAGGFLLGVPSLGSSGSSTNSLGLYGNSNTGLAGYSSGTGYNYQNGGSSLFGGG